MGWHARRILLLVVLGVGSAHAHANDPGADAPAAPAGSAVATEPGCVSCHTGFERGADAGRIELIGVPERYIPGRSYVLQFEIQHADAGRLRWGFRVTPVAAQTRAGTGRLRLVERRDTRLIRDASGRESVAHTWAGTAIGRRGGQRWSFEWIAPAAEAGEVSFLLSGVAADADGSEAGDLVYAGATAGILPAPAPSPEIPHAPEVSIQRE